MGHGYYSFEDRVLRSDKLGYKTKSIKDIFKSKLINDEMKPFGISFRESRDSIDHPSSIPVIIGLDVTGSMGSVPHFLVKEGLPNLMGKIMEKGIDDVQILFSAIGDHKYDKFPFQIGQFESSDDLMDKWLTSVYLEGGGGRNGGESYLLSWYFASRYTRLDSIEKRNKKGYLITIGDEPTFNEIPYKVLSDIFGSKREGVYSGGWGDIFEVDGSNEGKSKNYTALELLKEAQEMYNVYHIHISQTKSGKLESTIEGWYELLGDNLIEVEDRNDVSNVISDIIIKNEIL